MTTPVQPPARQNPLAKVADQTAALQRRPVSLYRIPNDERQQALQSGGDEAFDDVAAVGLRPLSYGEMKRIEKQYEGKPTETSYALLAAAMRGVVVGGPIMEEYVDEDDGEIRVRFADEDANPTEVTRLEGLEDVTRVMTRMHPITRNRAMVAFADVHFGKDGNTPRFLASKTIVTL